MDTDEEDLSGVIPRNCHACGDPITLIRLFYRPDTGHCVKCADKHGPQRVNDPEVLCAKASPSGQNGFSPKS
jgi:hypothetical protein